MRAAAVKKTRVALGKANATVKPGAATQLRFKLNKKARRLLARLGEISVQRTITIKQPRRA